MNGCLYFIPGKHVIGCADPYFDTSTACKVWSLTRTDVKKIFAEYGDPVAITGKSGSLTAFDCNLVHASGHNLSAQDRWPAYFHYSTMTIRPKDVEKPRTDCVRSQKWRPRQTLPDDGIVKASMAMA